MVERCTSRLSGLPCNGHEDSPSVGPVHGHCGPDGKLVAIWGDASADKPTPAQARELAAAIARTPPDDGTVTGLLQHLREQIAVATSAHAAGEGDRYLYALAEIEDTALCLREATRAPEYDPTDAEVRELAYHVGTQARRDAP